MASALVITSFEMSKKLDGFRHETVLASCQGHYLMHVLEIHSCCGELVDTRHYKIVSPQGEAPFEHLEQARQAWRGLFH